MRYRLKVHSRSTGVSELQVEASSEEDALKQVQAQGYLAFSVRVEKGSLKSRMKRGKRFSLLLFSQQLLSLLEAGLNLVEAIDALAGKEASQEMKAVLSGLLERLYAGEACSRAMESLPDSFPPFYVATMRASERSGDIAESLRRYIAYQNQIEEVRKKVTSAMIYPVLLLFAGGLVSLFLLGYVVPKFSQIYEDRATDLPYLSRLLMQWGGFVSAHGGIFVGGLASILVATGWAASRREFRSRVLVWLWTAPWIGERLRIYQLARFYRTLGMLLRGGTPITGAMDLVPGILSEALQRQLARASALVREGQSLSEALQVSGLTTDVAHRMLRVGEQSGNMGEMMARIAVFYDDEISRWIDMFVKVFEPVLMALIGVMVGGIVILMYMPIFDLAGSIQ